ncbi:SDR family oxidoreductase [Streptomyces sp. NPDC050625]|uniref:SDR family oxidoreductase n=1 Tax=Streptomyces sp. NPDC050625 TaxID=3154629 RepID=UPI0034493614
MRRDVLVIIGAGGMGLACARRSGGGKTILLADFHPATLSAAADELRDSGHHVEVQPVDISSREEVRTLARTADELGPVRHVVLTAGLSPTMADVERLLAVDLLGVAHVLEAFGEVVSPGGSGVVIASMAGHRVPELDRETEVALALTPAEELLALLPQLLPHALDDTRTAYGWSKRAAVLRVRGAASTSWADRGARVNSVSPGIILTKMAQQEFDGAAGRRMRATVEAQGTRRAGNPEDIAAAVAYLLSDDASYVTGVDLLVDGGAVAAARTIRPDLA